MRVLILFLFILSVSCKQKQIEKQSAPPNFIAVLDTVWRTEQTPITKRDSLIDLYGADDPRVKEQQEIYKKNHVLNEEKVLNILDTHGWPSNEMIGNQGNWTICNVLQHSSYEIRVKYLPLMETAVKAGKLEARFLVRSADRIATDNGDLQIYGGQMKYYRETQSFNLWPVFDPVNIDKRRTEIGLDSIAVFLKNRFDFEWKLDEQIQRSEAFIEAKKNSNL